MFTASWRFSPRTQLTPHRLISYTALGLFLNLLLIWLFLCPLEQSGAHPHARQAAAGSPLPLVKAAVTVQSGCPAVASISPMIGQLGSNITIIGTGFTGVTSVKFSNNINASFTINSDTQITATVPNSVVNSPITIGKTGCSNVQTTSFAVCPNPPTTLYVDNGLFRGYSNPAGGLGNYYVNRLTPASYPATLSRVSIFFGPHQNITADMNLSLVVGVDFDGDGFLNNTFFQTPLATTVQSLNQFNNYNIAPLTINSGDFVVGLRMAEFDSVPVDEPSTGGNRGRSHFSFNGLQFFSVGPDFMIRAQVFTGACGSGGCPTINVNPVTLPTGKVAAAYNQSITANGGASPYTFTLPLLDNAALPPGLLFDSSTGVLSGIPTQWGTFNFTVRATDTNGCFGERTYSLTINRTCQGQTTVSGSSLTLSGEPLPRGVINTTYNHSLTAFGFPPLSFTISTGTLPIGVSLSASGTLSGTPTQSGSFNFTVRVTNTNNCVGERTYALAINPTASCPLIRFFPEVLPDGVINTAYNQTLLAFGGVSPYSFLSIGLPSGLSLSASGVLSGIPTQAGEFNPTIRAMDQNGCIGSNYDNHGLAITCPTLTLTPMNQAFSANGGSGSISVATACNWTALFEGGVFPEWGVVTSGNSGTGPGTVSYFVAPNTNSAPRIRTLSVGPGPNLGTRFTITQAGCTSDISPNNQSFGITGGTGSVTVTSASSGCLWTTGSNVGWISVTSGSNGRGNGTVTFSVAANNTAGTRTGILTIADRQFTVTQAGCTYNMAPASQFFESPGGTGSISIETTSNCPWVARGDSNWISVTSNTGNGNGTITYSVAANSTSTQRTGNIRIYDSYIVPPYPPPIVGALLHTLSITQESNARIVRINNASAAPGSTVSVPITLVSKGDEHALGLSLNYDPALLSNPTAALGSDAGGASLVTNSSQVTQGRFGVLCSLPGAQLFAVGVRQAIVVTFNVIPITPGNTITISPGDQPITRQVVDLNGTSLPITFTSGTVTITPSPYEADVAPRQPFGTPDGQVTVGDWVVVGNFAAGLSTVNNGVEFQKADCAPRAGLGDGAINLADWSQAGRYAAALDPLTLAGGPTSRPAALSSAPLVPAQQRTLRAVNTVFQRGQINTLAVELDAQGDENTLGFSLNYDTNLLSFSSAALGNGASGATLLVNPNQTNSGKVGIAVGLLGGQHFAAGTRQIVLVNFNVAASGPTVSTPVSFGDQPIVRQVVDVNTNLVSATYANATITILQNGCQYTVSPLNQTFEASGGTDSITVTTSSGCGWNAMSNDSFINITAGSSGSGNGTVNYTVATNNGLARSGTITIAGQNINIQQSGPSLQFYPLATPVRLLDTRLGASPGACSQPNMPIAGQMARIQPGRNLCMIPGNAVALTGNVTTVLSGGGFLTLYPSDALQPTIASTNYGVNEIINNVFTVGLGTDGAFKIFAQNTTDVVVDVTGYYAPPGASGLYFHPLPAPVRLLETRAGLPVGCVKPGVPLVGGMDSLQMATTACTGIPAGARSVVGNATTVNPAGGGYLTLYPADVASAPLVASSNYNTGQIVNGPFTVGLSAAGQFKIFTTHTTDLVVDVLGYYSTEANDINGAGLLFNPLPRPVRLLETRPGLPVGCFKPGLPLAGGSETLQTARGVCDGVTIPANALGVVGNATVVFPVGGGFLTLWPSTAARPLVATSNYNPGDVGNRHFIVGLGNADGAFMIYTHATSDLVIDLSGYFAP